MSGTITVLHNGRVFTSEEDDVTLHDSLVIEGDKVSFVGTREAAERLIEQVCCCSRDRADSRHRMSNMSIWAAGSSYRV